MDYLRKLSSSASNYISSARTSLSSLGSRSISPLFNNSIDKGSQKTAEGTEEIANAIIPRIKFPIYAFLTRNVKRVKIGEELVPVKISSAIKTLGWTKEQFLSVAEKENAGKILIDAFEIKKKIDEIDDTPKDPSSLSSQDSVSSQSSMELENFYKNHSFSVQGDSSFLKFILQCLPNSHSSFYIHDSKAFKLDPNNRKIEVYSLIGKGANAQVFSGDKKTILKIVALTSLATLESPSDNAENKKEGSEEKLKKHIQTEQSSLDNDITLSKEIHSNDPLFTDSLTEKTSFSTITQSKTQASVKAPKDAPLIAMETRKAECDITSKLKTNPTAQEILQWQADLAEHYANHIHGNNIAHLDCKTDNMLLFNPPDNSNLEKRLYARANDFGGSVSIDVDSKTPLPISPGEDLIYTPKCTSVSEIFEYIKKAKEANDPTKGSAATRTECLHMLQKIDIFQLGVSFYQMASKDGALPFETYARFSKKSEEYTDKLKTTYPDITLSDVNNSPKLPIDQAQIRKNLTPFYGESSPKIDMIIRMLDMDPRNRPNAKEVSAVFSHPAGSA